MLKMIFLQMSELYKSEQKKTEPI